LCASFAIACGGATKTTAPPVATDNGSKGDQPPPPADERLMVLFERLSTELVTAGTDCNKYAQSVATWTTANRTRYPALHTEAKAADLPAERLALVNKSLEQSFTTSQVSHALQHKCNNHAFWIGCLPSPPASPPMSPHTSPPMSPGATDINPPKCGESTDELLQFAMWWGLIVL